MNRALQKNKNDWDELGQFDPYWSILSAETYRFGKWDSHLNEFFLSGEREINRVMIEADALGFPLGKDNALDFGCGVGRLTKPLANYFQHCFGVDISESMLALARKLDANSGQCQFILNTEANLLTFPNDRFDLIYSNIVLQHLPSQLVIKSFIREFYRVLNKNGLLIFQLPSGLAFRNKLQFSSKVYSLLRALGFSAKFLFEKMRLHPIKMNYLPEGEVIRLLNGCGARILKVQSNVVLGTLMQDRTYYVTKQ